MFIITRSSATVLWRTSTVRNYARNIHNTATTRCIYRSISRPQCSTRNGKASSRQWTQSRHLAVGAGAKRLMKQSPLGFTLAMILIACSSAGLLYTSFFYKSYIIDGFSRYPEPVAVKLRRALYYTNIALDAKKALKYFNETLQAAEEQRMDPLGDEVLGIRVQVALLLQKVDRHDLAARVLEAARGEFVRWLRERGDQPELAGRRNHVLQKAVALSVKLGEIYADVHLADREMAEERLVWAVETVLGEMKRREEEGVKEGEGEWMSDQEIGGSLEALAHHYESKDSHYLATPLFLQALNMTPRPSCHAATLMNNVATCLAQQPPRSSAYTTQLPSSSSSSSFSSFSIPSFSSPFSSSSKPRQAYNPPLSAARIEQIKQSQQWATRALEQARSISNRPSSFSSSLSSSASSPEPDSPQSNQPISSKFSLFSSPFPFSTSPSSPPSSSSSSSPQHEKQNQQQQEQQEAENTQECNHACVAALHNLGEFAEMLGNVREARERYTEARALAAEVDFAEGVVAARQGLKRLKGKS